jgi:hypothetical protein
MNTAGFSGLAWYLAVVQFVFLSCWTVYAIFLPGLLEQMGVPRTWAPWLLLADQVLFALFDVATGFYAERVFRLYGRAGPWIAAVTGMSCLAFLLLPWIAAAGTGGWQAPLFMLLAVLWVVTSSALRAPAFALLTRHAAAPQATRLAGLMLGGMALAGALAPYLGASLKGLDARLPFLISSVALIALAAGLIRAERQFVPAAAAPPPGTEQRAVPAWRFYGPLLLAALAFQWFFSLGAAPRYLQHASAAQLAWLMPVFWVGFNITVFNTGALTRHLGALHACGAGALLAGLAATLPGFLGGLYPLLSAQLLAGMGWGWVVAAGFGTAANLARSGAVRGESAAYGLLFAMLALATFGRIGAQLADAPALAAWPQILLWLPPLLWLLSAAVWIFNGHQPDGTLRER